MNYSKNKPSKFKSLSQFEVPKEEQKKIGGGFLFRMLDDIRCNVERSYSRFTGGNGDGDW